MKLFVWIESLLGPTPQVWGEVAQHQINKSIKVLQRNEMLPHEDDFSLDLLKAIYPYDNVRD